MNFESVYRHPVEWSGTMPEMDWVATGRAARWILREPATGRENMDIHWRFRVGEVVKLRLVNDRSALHAMQHPIHIHGQRFLVVSVNGVPNEHLVWKDTVLVPTGFVDRRAAGAVESRQVDAALSRRRAHRDGHANGVRGGRR